MDRLTIVASEHAEHQWEHAIALLRGAQKHGVASRIRNSKDAAIDTKHVACWGWRLGERFRERGHDVLVMERGYLGDRFSWSSFGWNGLNGRATFPDRRDIRRFRRIVPAGLGQWRADTGEYVLIIGQVPGDASLGGNDLRQWYEDTAADAAALYGRPVRFRPHPAAVERGFKFKVSAAPTLPGSLAEALAGAHLVVTFNSNTAVDAVIAGVPTVTFDEGSMAYAVTGHTLADRITPERNEWAARLACRQWTLAEIERGDAWEAMRKCAPATEIAEAA